MHTRDDQVIEVDVPAAEARQFFRAHRVVRAEVDHEAPREGATVRQQASMTGVYEVRRRAVDIGPPIVAQYAAGCLALV